MRLNVSPLLERQVLSPLRGVLGCTLEAVEYGCFPFEVEILREGKTELLELDGEVRLQFEGHRVVFLSWCQVPGWNEVNSVGLSQESFSTNGALQYLDVGSSPIWSSCLGHRLLSAEVLGWNQTPAIVRLRFDETSVLVGIGYEQGFGDADCVIVRPDESMWLFSGTEGELLWLSTYADA